MLQPARAAEVSHTCEGERDVAASAVARNKAVRHGIEGQVRGHIHGVAGHCSGHAHVHEDGLARRGRVAQAAHSTEAQTSLSDHS